MKLVKEHIDFKRGVEPKDAMGTGIKSKMGRDKGYEPLYNDGQYSIEKYFNHNTRQYNLIIVGEPLDTSGSKVYNPKSVLEFPIMYDNGSIAYDNPFRIPEYIKQLVKKYYPEIRKK